MRRFGRKGSDRMQGIKKPQRKGPRKIGSDAGKNLR